MVLSYCSLLSFYTCLVPLSPVVSQCSVSSSDLKDLQKLMRQYKSDVAVFNRQKKVYPVISRVLLTL